MGMDVYGKKDGTYFRSSIWNWPNLWKFVSDVAIQEGLMTEETARGGYYNDGHGLDGEASRKLAAILREKLDAPILEAPPSVVPKNEGMCGVMRGLFGIPEEKDDGMPNPERLKEFVQFLSDCDGFEIC